MAENTKFQEEVVKSILGSASISEIKFDNNNTPTNEENKLPTDVEVTHLGKKIFFQFKNINTTDYADIKRKKESIYSTCSSFSEFVSKFNKDKIEFNADSTIHLFDSSLILEIIKFEGIKCRKISIYNQEFLVDEYGLSENVDAQNLLNGIVNGGLYYECEIINVYGIKLLFKNMKNSPKMKGKYVPDFMPVYTNNLLFDRIKIMLENVEVKYSSEEHRIKMEKFGIKKMNHSLVIHTYEYCCHEELEEVLQSLKKENFKSSIFSRLYLTCNGKERVELDM